MVKPIWNSKTFWFGILTAVSGVVAIFYPPAAQFMSKYSEMIAMAWGVIAVLLRMITKDKVKLID